MARKGGYKALLELPASLAKDHARALATETLDAALAARPMDALEERAARLRARIAALEAERDELAARINSELRDARQELDLVERAAAAAAGTLAPLAAGKEEGNAKDGAPP
ncbi:MAG: hypothetical protein SNJ79_09525, partial [Sphingomonadaceae bacterium]